MAIRRISERDLRAASEEFRKQLAAGEDAPRPKVYNEAAAAQLAAPTEVEHRGVIYDLVAPGWVDGVRLQRASYDLRDAEKDDDVEVYSQTLHGIVPILRRHMRPRPLLRRILWWAGLNRRPFRRATEGELGLLHHFLSLSRMRSSVRVYRGGPGESPRSTSSMDSSSSRPHSLRSSNGGGGERITATL